MDIVKVMDEEALHEDRGAFFRSIMGTLNHLLWGDVIWMSRWCDDIDAPGLSIAQSVDYTKAREDWQTRRARMDDRILEWAGTLTVPELSGDLKWYSGAQGRDVSRPKALCVTHMFNHQTHHRGQVHAMLTAGGHPAPTSDLVFMPEDL